VRPCDTWEGRHNYCCPSGINVIGDITASPILRGSGYGSGSYVPGEVVASLAGASNRPDGAAIGGRGVSTRPLRACRTWASVGVAAASSVCGVSSAGPGTLVNETWTSGEFDVAQILEEKRRSFPHRMGELG
jgi:hypothetical protein